MRITLCRLVVVCLVAFTSTHSQVTTDSKTRIGSYLFGALRARAIGPAVMGGRIAAMDVVNNDPKVIYVGAASGGLWKSINGGTTFESIFDKYTQSIGAIAIDQSAPDTIWVGTGEPWVRNSVSVGTGIYKTTDGGESWQFCGLENSERIGRIIIDPRNSDIVYVAVLGHLWNANEDRGLYKTTDGGENWKKVLYVDENTGCTDIAVDPQEPDIIYAATWQFRREPDFFTSGGPGSGLYKSNDGGQNWKKLSRGLPDGDLGRIAIAVAPSRPSVVYAVIESEETALYRSQDLGETWTEMGTSSDVKSRPFYFSLLLVDPVDYNRLYKPGTMMATSKDGGETFRMSMFGGVHPDFHALWINPANPSHFLLGTDGGLYVSYDRGSSYRFLNNLPISQFYHVSCDMNRPYNVYGGLQDNGSWFGPSQSPSGIENKDWQSVGYGDGFHVLADPTDNDIIYWEYQGGNIRRYHKSTGETKDIMPFPKESDPEYRFNWNTPIVLSPNDPERIYIGAQFLFRTTDKGESWQRLSGDLTTNDKKKQRQEESGGLTIDNTTAENHCTIYTISESLMDKDLIWVGTDDGNLQVTENSGESWRNVIGKIDGLPEHTWCSYVETSHHHRETAYAAFDGHRTGDMQVYLYKTTDLGKSWQSISTDVITGYVHVIREDTENADLLYVGTEFGLFVSIDGGQQWAHFTEGLPNVSVRDIVLHPMESDLVLATHGRGIYIIDDITPLRQISDQVLASNMYLFKSPPVIITDPGYHQQFPGSGDFVGQNPEEVATISFYLKKRHLFGDLNVEVYDPDGNLLTTLLGGKRKGINRVNWYMRLKPPKVAPSPTLAYAALFGPMVPEGTYSVKLIKGKDTCSGEITLAADPALPHSVEDRAFQRETVMKLYQMQDQLAYVAAAVSNVKDQTRGRVDKLKKDEGLKKTLTEFADKLEKLHKTLVVVERKPGITGEEQLREKVVSLYGSISGYRGRPTGSQLERISVLEGEIEKANREFESIVAKDLDNINSKLKKKDLEPIELLTKEG